MVEAGGIARVPLGRVFRTSWRQLILGTFIMLATYVLFYLMSTFTLTFGTTASSVEAGKRPRMPRASRSTADAFVAGLGYTRPEFLIMLIIGVVVLRHLHDGRPARSPSASAVARCCQSSRSASSSSGCCSCRWRAAVSSGVMAWLILGFSLMGLTFGPMGAMLPELFATNVRYTGSGVSYNVSSIIGASVAPFIAVALWQAADGSIVLRRGLPVARGDHHACCAATVQGVERLGLHDDCGVAGGLRPGFTCRTIREAALGAFTGVGRNGFDSPTAYPNRGFAAPGAPRQRGPTSSFATCQVDNEKRAAEGDPFLRWSG